MFSSFPAKNQRGVAIITALFIMTIVAIITTAISLNLQLFINKTEQIENVNTIYHKMDNVFLCQMGELLKSSEKKNKTYSINQVKAIKKDKISASLIDLQSQFNINNLSNNQWQYSFIQLLTKVSPDLTEEDAQKITLSLVAWIRPLTSNNQASIIDRNIYLKTPFQAMPAHQFLVSKTELRFIKIIDAKLYQKLSPYLSALPEVTPININTADRKILKILGNGLSDPTIKAIIKKRKKKPFKNYNELQLIKGYSKANIPKSMISFNSNYFLSTINYQDSHLNLDTFRLVNRKINRKMISLAVLDFSINTL